MKTEKVKIGEFGVDSGTVMICDPCLISSKSISVDIVADNVDSILKATNNFGGEITLKDGASVFVAETGLGDGIYEINAYVTKSKIMGQRRIQRLEIVFI